jgi:hypothetical protein
VLDIRCSTGFLACTFVLALGTACNKADESKSDAEAAKIHASPDQLLVGHEFLRLTEAKPELANYFITNRDLGFAVGEGEDYYLSVGRQVFAVDRTGNESSVRVLELPFPLELLGIHGEQLVLFGPDPDRCVEEQPGPCASVYRRSREGEGPTELVAAFDVFGPVLVGDQVAALVDPSLLMSVSLANGEVRRTTTPAKHAMTRLAAQGDRLMWDEVDVSTQRTVVVQSRAPFDEAKVVFQLEDSAERIDSLAWVGDDIVYLVAQTGQLTKLHYRIGEQSQVLSNVRMASHLVNDSGGAWLVARLPGEEQLLRITPRQYREVVFEVPPKLLAAPTHSGLIWIEEREGSLSFFLTGSGPAGFQAGVLEAKIVELPVAEPEPPSSDP